jgi:hypothetical protein
MPLMHVSFCNFRWINRKDVEGRNIFTGGFLGLDNIGIFDRSKPLPTGKYKYTANVYLLAAAVVL